MRPLRFIVGERSDTGSVRTENQDRVSRCRTNLAELFLLADGMGGHQGGELAAKMAVQGFENHLRGVVAGTPWRQALAEAYQRTDQEILARSKDGGPPQMGSTVVLLLASGTQAMVAHAGDSRAYLFRDNQLVRLTKDHSVVQRMVDDHIIAPEQAEGHPNANQLTRALGLGLELGLEISEPFTVQPGDIVLLCSDGLSGFVNDEAISQAIRDGIHPQKIADRLVDLALAAGGEDNVSVQLIKFEARAPVVFLPPRRLANRGRLVAMLLALFGLAAAGTVLYFGGFLNRVGSRGHAETKTAHEPLATKSAPSEPPPNKSSKKQPSNVAPPPRLANENTSRPERPTGRGRGAEGTDEKQQEELIITPRDDQKPDSAPRKPAPSLQQPNFLLVLPLGGQIRDWAHSSAVIVCDKLPKGDTVYYCNDGDLGECLKGLRDLLKQDVTHLRVEKVSQAPTLLQCIEAQGRALQDYVAVILRPKKGKI